MNRLNKTARRIGKNFVPSWLRRRIDKLRHRAEFTHRKINFMIVGVQKSGSSALSTFLAAHPDVCFSSVKETNFFETEPYLPDYDAYHRAFPRPAGRKAIGEGSVIYLYSEMVIERIKAYNPNTKIIVIIRNPIERAYSHYQMHCHLYGLDIPFMECIRLAEKELPAEQYFHRCQPLFSKYVEFSLTCEHIRQFQQNFEDVLCVKQDDLLHNQHQLLRQVFEFLEIDTRFRPPQKTIFSHTYQQIPQEVWQYLHSELSNEIDQLQQLTGWNLAHWKQRSSLKSA